jgi:hypothetical protein
MAIYSIEVHEYHSPQKISPKNFTHNPSFEIYISIFSNFVMGIILSQIFSISSNSSIFIGFF